MNLYASPEGRTQRGVPPVKDIIRSNPTFTGVRAPKQRSK